MEENWGIWKVGNKTISKYYVESINDSIEGFCMVLSDANDECKRIKILFENSVHAYRSTDESYRQNTINKLDKRYGTEFYGDHTFLR